MIHRGGGRRARLGGIATTAGSVLLVVASAFGAGAAPQSTEPAAAADAYAVLVDAVLPQLNVPVRQGPLARASQEYPPQASQPDEAAQFGIDPIPAGGELISNIGVITSSAGANSQPLTAAAAQALDVRLLSQGGVPLISADVVKAVATTDCINSPSAAGTELVNVRVAGALDPVSNPAPNTELAPQIFNPLGIRVVLNEQHPAADGRGLVVNGIHIYNYSPSVVPPLFRGDIVIAHAMATVNCPNGAGSTGMNSPVVMVKTADVGEVGPGDTVTYNATVSNKTPQPCLVNRFIEHLAGPFTLVSTSGDLGEVTSTEARPGGGTDIVFRPADVGVPAGQTISQQFVVKVADDAPLGTYFNNLEIFCTNLGNFVKGLDAPVEVGTTTTVDTTTTTIDTTDTTDRTQPSTAPSTLDRMPETLAKTGSSPGLGPAMASALLIVGLAIGAASRRQAA